MTKKLLPTVALSALALIITLAPAWTVSTAQQVASLGRAGGGSRGGGAAAASATRRLLKRMSMSVAESADGTRVRLTSDAPLEGVESYADGGRFFVVVPEADAAVLAPQGFAGRGFTRVEAGQRGDDALIAFTPAPGYTPRARASFNRLEVVFAAQNLFALQQQQAGGSAYGADAAGSPTPTPTPTPISAPSASDNSSDAKSTPAGAGTNANSNNGAAATTPAANAPGAAGGNKAARLAALITPEKASPTELKRFAAPPVIDGKLDDEVWKTAAVFKDFVQFRPVDLVAPSEPTEVRIGYDSRFLYVGFHAYDEPGKVRATIAKRDAVFDDD
ncbi:MAG TPA: hypothetical protein VNZ44_06650, partial [Pyrinomonadaceae bacterium]|nr:hypothetical protein [Pyrinomonadaceae bacterium]